MRGRLLLMPGRSGPWNMAVDEALLLDAPPETITLRLYGWKPATLSLGAFQPYDRIPEAWRRRFPLVRRASGGQAILHREDEITFSISGGSGKPPAEVLKRWIHGAMQEALRPFRLQPEPAVPGEPSEAFFCYCLSTSLDLTLRAPGEAGVRKLIGTAARRRGSAWLIHGFLPLSSDPEVAGSIGLADALGAPLEPAAREQLMQGLAAGFAAGMGVALQPDALRPDEMHRAGRLAIERFADSGWLRRR